MTPEPNEFGEIELAFDEPVPDGSHLVVSSTDEADNQNATLFVLDEASTNAVDLANPAYDGFDISAIDLNFADSSDLSLSLEVLESMSSNSSELTVDGRMDDNVGISGGTKTSETRTSNDRDYDVYTFDDGVFLLALNSEVTTT